MCQAADKFIASADANHDGTFSEDEIKKLNRHGQRTIAELVAFHDVNEDGVVSTKEVKDSWVMYATSIYELMKITKTTPPRPKYEIVQQSGDEGHNNEDHDQGTNQAVEPSSGQVYLHGQLHDLAVEQTTAAAAEMGGKAAILKAAILARASASDAARLQRKQRQTAATRVAIEANTQHHLNLQRDHL